MNTKVVVLKIAQKKPHMMFLILSVFRVKKEAKNLGFILVL